MYKVQSLNGIWNLQKGNDEKSRVLAKVPGTVLGAMLEGRVLEDPFWRCNEYRTREFMAADFIYDREFVVESLDYDVIELVCEGLDTIATIMVNGKEAARADDMHRTYRLNVKGFLKEGKNCISIRFESALLAARKEDAENDIFYASTGCIHGNAVMRKAHYMFGWDWGPQLIDAGIFRNITLEYSRQPRFADIQIRQKHEDDGSVMLLLRTSLRDWGTLHLEKELWEPERMDMAQWENGCPADRLELVVTIEDPDGQQVITEHPYQEEISFEISNPRLWWPNGVGDHPLYKVSVELKTGDGAVCDRCSKRIGLRTIEVCTDAHEYGSEFAFVVNGVKIFAMGANYIPEDILLDRIQEDRTRRLVKDCERANYNCIRVWGGGYYPDDYFYDACDEAGIMVWQDLMFACNVYALTDHFEENIVEETKDNVRRLRHHACLALWCGNNEMEWGWGDEWARIRGHHPRYKADYIKIFEYILPKALKSCDDVTFYWPSSPSSGGNLDDPNAVNRGDQHYWEVWHSGKPFTEYRKEYFSFCSEYGFQSFPGMKTIKSFTCPEDRNIFSQVMESHQKNGAANGKILNYVADYFLYPKSLADLVYISQVLQLKAIQYGVEHWRRNRGRCMGSLYWQINDCWPVASWASIDYFGRWKALHYGARRFYAPVMVSACEKEELSSEISYFVNNDTLEPFQGRVEAALIDRDFGVFWEYEESITVEPMSVKQSFAIDYQHVISGREGRAANPADSQPEEHMGQQKVQAEAAWDVWEERRSGVFARVRLFSEETQVSEQVTLFVKPKHFCYRKPEYVVTVTETEERFDIRVKSSSFAQYVELELDELDGVFSDNYFDITTPDGVMVSLQKTEFPTGMGLENLKRQIRVRSVADSYDVG